MTYYHKKYLQALMRNPQNHIDLDHTLQKILIEPKWFTDSGDEISLCDGILIFDDFAVPLELKQSILKRKKALKQLQNGRKYITEKLQLKFENYGIFAVYNPLISPQYKLFNIEKIMF